MNTVKFYLYYNLSNGIYEVHFSKKESPLLSYFGSGVKESHFGTEIKSKENVEPTPQVKE